MINNISFASKSSVARNISGAQPKSNLKALERPVVNNDPLKNLSSRQLELSVEAIKFHYKRTTDFLAKKITAPIISKYEQELASRKK